MPDSGNRATKVGEKVLELQRRLPSARIVYCSATGAPAPSSVLSFPSRTSYELHLLSLYGSGPGMRKLSPSDIAGALTSRAILTVSVLAYSQHDFFSAKEHAILLGRGVVVDERSNI